MAISTASRSLNLSFQTDDLRHLVMDCLESSIQHIDKGHFISNREIRNFLWRYNAQELALIHMDLNAICQNTFSGAEKNNTFIIAKSLDDFSYERALIFNTESHDVSSMKFCLKHQGDPARWKEAFLFIESVRLALALKEGFYIVHKADETFFQKPVQACITDHYGYSFTDYSC